MTAANEDNRDNIISIPVSKYIEVYNQLRNSSCMQQNGFV